MRAHAGLIVLVALAVALRAAVAEAYGPALLFSDSLGYIRTAFAGVGDGFVFAGVPVGFTEARPSGYPLVLRFVADHGGTLATVTVLQHLAGVLTGALVYALAVRLGARRSLALVAAALVLLDAYTLALEQHVMAEALFTLALAAAVALAIVRPRAVPERVVGLAASGALLAAAATMRPSALFAVPVWLVYLAWSRVGWLPALAGALALLGPLYVYAENHKDATGTFGMTQSSGWFLYGRVGALADCRLITVPPADRRLCNSRPRDHWKEPSYYIWNRFGPARRTLGWGGSPRRHARVDVRVGRFAREVIADRPGAYARIVAVDLLRFFESGVESPYGDDVNVTLPTAARTPHVQPVAPRTPLGPRVERPRAPAGALRAYARWFHVPRLAMGLLALAGVVGVLAGIASRGRWVPHRREVLLLVGSALAMLIGTAATSNFSVRYLLPTVPLLAAGGVAAGRELVAALGGRGAGG